MSQILFADDDAAMRQMVADVLTSAGHSVRLAGDGTTALTEIRRQPPDLVILDYRMGRPDGFAVCREIKSTPRLDYLPVMILTAQNTTEEKLGGFGAGADDYLAKPFDARELVARVGALLRLSRAGRDQNPTSGLPGGEAIEREYRARSTSGRITVCYLDLDHFKPFGDRFGFTVADAAIRDVGEAILDAAREGEFVGHVGGDDFVVLCEPQQARPLVAAAQADFRDRVSARLPPEDAARGTFRAVGRDGEERIFSITQLSAAILHLRGPELPEFAALGPRVAALKQEAKQQGTGGIAEGEWSDTGS